MIIFWIVLGLIFVGVIYQSYRKTKEEKEIIGYMNNLWEEEYLKSIKIKKPVKKTVKKVTKKPVKKLKK